MCFCVTTDFGVCLIARRFLFVTMNEKNKLPSRYSPVIGAINARLKRFADEQDRVTFADCNAELVEVGTVCCLLLNHHLERATMHAQCNAQLCISVMVVPSRNCAPLGRNTEAPCCAYGRMERGTC